MSSDDETEENWSKAWNEIAGDNSSVVQSSSWLGATTMTFLNNAEINQPACLTNETGPPSDDGVVHSAVIVNDNKAGMEGLDKDRINQIIYEASKGSSFYKKEQRREEELNRHIKEQEERHKNLNQHQVAFALQKADQLLEKLDSHRDLSRTIVHVDMDAFYAAVEILDRSELKDKPMAVGSNSMLSTSNYAARRFGVRAGMPGFIARKLCSSLVIIPCNFDKYTAMSRRFQRIFAEYDANFSAASLDEAYMDITDHLEQRKQRGMDGEFSGYPDPSVVCLCSIEKKFLTRCSSCGKRIEEKSTETFGLTAEEVVREMRYRIRQETHLTSSAGIAPNTMLAKVCSDRNKPNGQFSISPTRETIMDFIKDLPIRKIGGIGKVTERMLKALGVVTCSHLYEKRGLLYHLYSSLTFEYFMRICLGIASSRVENGGQRKSMSVERTFREISEPPELEQMCKDLSQMLTYDLCNEELMGKTVTLKLKTVEFEVRTRAQTFLNSTQDADVIFVAAFELLKGEMAACSPQPLRLRLMGVRMSSLSHISEKDRSQQCKITSLIQHLRHKQENASTQVSDINDTQFIKSSSHNVSSESSVSSLNNTQFVKSSDTINSESTLSIENDNTQFFESTQTSRTESTFPCYYIGERQKIVATTSKIENQVHPFISPEGKIKINRSSANKNELSLSCVINDNSQTVSTNREDFSEDSDNNVSRRSTRVETENEINFDASTSTSSPTDSSTSSFVCPLCNAHKFYWDLNDFNRHIDVCLNRETVRDILTKEKKLFTQTTNRSEAAKSPVAKRRKREHGKSEVTLHKYFQPKS